MNRQEIITVCLATLTPMLILIGCNCITYKYMFNSATSDLTPHEGFTTRRFENDEVICYAASSSISCKWKVKQ